MTIGGASTGYAVVGNKNGTLSVTLSSGAGTAQVVASGKVAVFTDGVGIADPTGVVGSVERLYEAAFNRSGDISGLEYWAKQVAGGASLSSVATFLSSSTEFKSDYGTLSNSAFVNQLYENVLGRGADTAGSTYWSHALANGETRGQVMISFAQSVENRADHITTSDDPNYGTAYRLYQAAFDRAPDTTGISYWTKALDNGMTAQQVAAAFTSSAEFKTDFANATGSTLVGKLYENVLGRAGDTGGINYWSAALAGGQSAASVLLGFANSTENVTRTASATHAGWVFVPTS